MLRAQTVAKVGQTSTDDTLTVSLPNEGVLTVYFAVDFTTWFLEVIGYGHLSKNRRLSTICLLHLLVWACGKVGVIGSVCCSIWEWLDHFLIVWIIDGRILSLQAACRCRTKLMMLDAIHSNWFTADWRRTVLLLPLFSVMVLWKRLDISRRFLVQMVMVSPRAPKRATRGTSMQMIVDQTIWVCCWRVERLVPISETALGFMPSFGGMCCSTSWTESGTWSRVSCLIEFHVDEAAAWCCTVQILRKWAGRPHIVLLRTCLSLARRHSARDNMMLWAAIGSNRKLLAASCLLNGVRCVGEVSWGDHLNLWVVLLGAALLLHDELLLHGNITVGNDTQGVPIRRLDEVAHAGVKGRASRQTVCCLKLCSATDCASRRCRGELLLLDCWTIGAFLSWFVAVCVLLRLIQMTLLLLRDVTHDGFSIVLLQSKTIPVTLACLWKVWCTDLYYQVSFYFTMMELLYYWTCLVNQSNKRLNNQSPLLISLIW